uniref:RRM domain-containing protein n=1 Tax=Romanomermis culicivorax TaxID=13658 RepID=A0A915I934_ROMCU
MAYVPYSTGYPYGADGQVPAAYPPMDPSNVAMPTTTSGLTKQDYLTEFFNGNENIDEFHPRTLYVGNLDPSVSEDFLLSIFAAMGTINKCKIIYETANEPYAFIEFTDHNAAVQALTAMNRRMLLGKCFVTSDVPGVDTGAFTRGSDASPLFIHVIPRQGQKGVKNFECMTTFNKFGSDWWGNRKLGEVVFPPYPSITCASIRSSNSSACIKNLIDVQSFIAMLKGKYETCLMRKKFLFEYIG